MFILGYFRPPSATRRRGANLYASKSCTQRTYIGTFVDMSHAPQPKALFAGMDRLTLVIVREDGGLRLRGFVK